MAWLLRLVTRLTGIAFALGLLGLGVVYYLVSRSLPEYDQDRVVTGVSAPVEIVRDAYAVPHILGQTDADVYFGLGYAHAQDRLWQMELARRAAQGRLAEVFGPRAVKFDALMRSLELHPYAVAAVEAQSADVRAALASYAAGVNARIDIVNKAALGRGAPEFFAFPAALAPWTAADSLAVMKMMAFRLSAAASSETRRARFLLKTSPEDVADLFPDYPDGGVTALPKYAALFDGAEFAKLEPAKPDPVTALFGPPPTPELAGASNAWAVDGARSASGAPLLASDPHLWLSAPSVWYLTRLEFPDGGVIGATLPGIPAIIIGRNQKLAWGLTTANFDDQDIFIERLNPDNPQEYLTPDGWEPIETRETLIAVDGAPPVSMTLRRTRHGPVPPLEQFGLATITPAGYIPALAWTALTSADQSLEAMMRLMRAGTLEDARDAAALHVAPAQNVIVSDGKDVAMFVAGRAPLRKVGSGTRGRVPSPGWTGEHDWIGYVPANRLPSAMRPESGVVANANNRTTDAEYPYHLTYDWDTPYRIRRIEKQLGARRFHSAESFRALQNDAVSEMARSVLPLVANDLWWGAEGVAAGANPLRAEALERLADWNGEMSEHAPEPLIFAAWMRALTTRLTADELGPLAEEYAGMRPLFVERVFHDVDGASRWCDIDKTAQRETCAQVAALALDDALAELSKRYGGNLSAWRWGEAHVAVHEHAPLGQIGWLGWLVNLTQETSGGDFTVLRGMTKGSGDNPYLNVHAAAFRAVYDFENLDNSVYIESTGQSGHPLSRHYDDLSETWALGGYIPMTMDMNDVRAGAIGVMRLIPR